MCGRYSLTKPPEAMRQLFRFRGNLPNLPPRYNIAPSQDAPVIRLAKDGEREFVQLHWGLVPSWSKDPKTSYSTINARAETVATKPAYRAAFKARRCLIPADGFYEWRKAGTRKQPYRIALKDDGLFAFAGLWEHWEGNSSEALESFTIIVTEANDLLKTIHDRMPVILDPADYDPWLKAATPADAQKLLRPFPAAAMKAYPIGTKINSPRNDDASILEPLEGGAGELP